MAVLAWGRMSSQHTWLHWRRLGAELRGAAAGRHTVGSSFWAGVAWGRRSVQLHGGILFDEERCARPAGSLEYQSLSVPPVNSRPVQTRYGRHVRHLDCLSDFHLVSRRFAEGQGLSRKGTCSGGDGCAPAQPFAALIPAGTATEICTPASQCDRRCLPISCSRAWQLTSEIRNRTHVPPLSIRACLNPKIVALHHTPYTLYPIPSILDCKPQTLNPNP